MKNRPLQVILQHTLLKVPISERKSFMKFRFGIIGVGSMGRNHVESSIATMPDCEVTAICDTDPEALARFKDHPAKLFDTDDAFFAGAKDLVDAIIIATPHYDHVPLAIRAIELGKHVVVEKPVAVQKSEALRLNEVIARHPELKIAAMFCQRCVPAHRKIKELIDSGEMGEIRRVNWIITNWFRTQAYYDSGSWRASWRGEGGGVLLNQCPHQLDLIQWLCGMPVKVNAHMSFGKYHNIEVEDDVTAYMEYPNGATGVFIASTGEAPGTNRLEITAERGKLVYENGVINYTRNEVPMSEFCKTTSQRFATPPVWNVTIPASPSNNYMHRDILTNLKNAVLNGEPLIAQAVEGVNGLELGNAMLLSHLEDRTVELPIDAALFDEHLNKLIASSTYKKEVSSVKDTNEFGGSFGVK